MDKLIEFTYVSIGLQPALKEPDVDSPNQSEVSLNPAVCSSERAKCE
jgi:hypothetical protein